MATEHTYITINLLHSLQWNNGHTRYHAVVFDWDGVLQSTVQMKRGINSHISNKFQFTSRHVLHSQLSQIPVNDKPPITSYIWSLLHELFIKTQTTEFLLHNTVNYHVEEKYVTNPFHLHISWMRRCICPNWGCLVTWVTPVTNPSIKLAFWKQQWDVINQANNWT